MTWFDLLIALLWLVCIAGAIYTQRIGRRLDAEHARLHDQMKVDTAQFVAQVGALQFLQSAGRLMPGQIYKAHLKGYGIEVAVIHYEDLEIMARKAGYEFRELEDNKAVWTPRITP